MKNNEEKAKELAHDYFRRAQLGFCSPDTESAGYECAMKMAEWKEQQMMELWNVARNVYEAWMGGTMNDVRECMKDLGHVYDEFKNKGM